LVRVDDKRRRRQLKGSPRRTELNDRPIDLLVVGRATGGQAGGLGNGSQRIDPITLALDNKDAISRGRWECFSLPVVVYQQHMACHELVWLTRDRCSLRRRGTTHSYVDL
jgi:hypothetical protein